MQALGLPWMQALGYICHMSFCTFPGFYLGRIGLYVELSCTYFDLRYLYTPPLKQSYKSIFRQNIIRIVLLYVFGVHEIKKIYVIILPVPNEKLAKPSKTKRRAYEMYIALIVLYVVI